MLEGAIAELWDYQKGASERQEKDGNSGEDRGLEAMSVAIAKVQFVQVYLEDASLPLPAEDERARSPAPSNPLVETARSADSEVVVSAPDPAPTQEQESSLNPVPETIPSTLTPSATVHIETPITTDVSDPFGKSTPVSASPTRSSRRPSAPPSYLKPAVTTTAGSTTDLPPAPSYSRPPKLKSLYPDRDPPARPPLAQSSFSWMLGQEEPREARSEFVSVAGFMPTPERAPERKNRGFLFGDEGETGDIENVGGHKEKGKVVTKKKGGKEKGKERGKGGASGNGGEGPLFEEDSFEEIGMGTLRR